MIVFVQENKTTDCYFPTMPVWGAAVTDHANLLAAAPATPSSSAALTSTSPTGYSSTTPTADSLRVPTQNSTAAASPHPYRRRHYNGHEMIGRMSRDPTSGSRTSAKIDHVTSEPVDPGLSPVDVLTRWELFGGTWRVLDRDGVHVTIALFRCDGGEEQQRLTSADPALTFWLNDRISNRGTTS